MDVADVVACFGQNHHKGMSQSETDCPTLSFLLCFLMNVKVEKREMTHANKTSLCNYMLEVIKFIVH